MECLKWLSMENLKWLNTLGLILDVIGVLIIFKASPKKEQLGVFLFSQKEALKSKKSASIYNRFAVLGLVIIGIGFLFQFIYSLVVNLTN